MSGCCERCNNGDNDNLTANDRLLSFDDCV